MLDGCCSSESLSIIFEAILDFLVLISVSLSSIITTDFVGVFFLGVVSTPDPLSGLSGTIHTAIDVDKEVGLAGEDVALRNVVDLNFDGVDRDDLRGLSTSMLVPKRFFKNIQVHELLLPSGVSTFSAGKYIKTMILKHYRACNYVT